MSKFGVVILTFAFESNYEWQKKKWKERKKKNFVACSKCFFRIVFYFSKIKI